MSETGRQRFIRNHAEETNAWRAIALKAERNGEYDLVAAVNRIIATWERLYQKALAEEAAENGTKH